MKKHYSDLNLKAIREAAKLDFAHFTYKNNMCSCCYGPADLPDLYWTSKEAKKRATEGRDFSFILFKNANNGSGTVTKNDTIENGTYLEWSLSKEQMDIVISLLQEQLGRNYLVHYPKSEYDCIGIFLKESATA